MQPYLTETRFLKRGNNLAGLGADKEARPRMCPPGA
jgi:hypothetical protein